MVTDVLFAISIFLWGMVVGIRLQSPRGAGMRVSLLWGLMRVMSTLLGLELASATISDRAPEALQRADANDVASDDKES